MTDNWWDQGSTPAPGVPSMPPTPAPAAPVPPFPATPPGPPPFSAPAAAPAGAAARLDEPTLTPGRPGMADLPGAYDRAPGHVGGAPPIPPPVPPSLPPSPPPSFAPSAPPSAATGIATPRPGVGRIIGGLVAGVAIAAGLAFAADWILGQSFVFELPSLITVGLFAVGSMVPLALGFAAALWISGLVDPPGLIGRSLSPVLIWLAGNVVLHVVWSLVDGEPNYGYFDGWESSILVVSVKIGAAVAIFFSFGRGPARRGALWFFPAAFAILVWPATDTSTGSYGWNPLVSTITLTAVTALGTLIAASILAARTSAPATATLGAPGAFGATGAGGPVPGMPAATTYYDQFGNPVMMMPAAPSTNGLAVASLVLGLIGFNVPAIVLGHIALSQIKRSGGVQSGRGMAIAGLVLGYLVLALFVAFWIVVWAGASSYSY